ncbi:hypothetical protein ACIQVK_28400 [Streptomyces sp. NPDC090493]|uniref:hypothetical protein n=1 Tax=Streptomyces sp. NPDC090493 TaxID=3365964 RepID=UPI00381C972A
MAALLADHWQDRASESPHEQDLGLNFSGRHEVTRELAGFVGAGSDVGWRTAASRIDGCRGVRPQQDLTRIDD